MADCVKNARAWRATHLRILELVADEGLIKSLTVRHLLTRSDSTTLPSQAPKTLQRDQGQIASNPHGRARCPHPGLHQAPGFLPLLHPMEERAGERRCVFIGFPSPRSSPHSFLAGRGWRA